MTDKEFIETYNECYPFERYIVKNPKKINYLFDDALLCELFIPSTEIKLIIYNGEFVGSTQVNKDEIYVKLKCKNDDENWIEFRMAYYDFNDHIREESYPCMGIACPNRNVKHLYCDECGDDVEKLYKYDGQEICEDCLLKEFEVIE